MEHKIENESHIIYLMEVNLPIYGPRNIFNFRFESLPVLNIFRLAHVTSLSVTSNKEHDSPSVTLSGCLSKKLDFKNKSLYGKRV